MHSSHKIWTDVSETLKVSDGSIQGRQASRISSWVLAPLPSWPGTG